MGTARGHGAGTERLGSVQTDESSFLGHGCERAPGAGAPRARRYSHASDPLFVTPPKTHLFRRVSAKHFSRVAVLTAAAVGMSVWLPSLSSARDRTSGRANDRLVDNVADPVEAPVADARDLVGDSLFGYSDALRARFVAPHDRVRIPVLHALFGDTAATAPGVYTVRNADGSPGFHFMTLRPFADKVRGRIGAYRIGQWSGETRAPQSAAYATPPGFIEVTAENQRTHVSEHFQLRHFLTKDQPNVWPKYLVLNERLLDKLELLIAELEKSGVNVPQLSVMSGFRTPAYNAQGVGSGGRATESRHQYGDAADVYIRTADRDWLPDLDGDGRVTTRDARIIASAVERVEAQYPELVGGIGIYPANSVHGPFVHVDVRGVAARWGNW